MHKFNPNFSVRLLVKQKDFVIQNITGIKPNATLKCQCTSHQLVAQLMGNLGLKEIPATEAMAEKISIFVPQE